MTRLAAKPLAGSLPFNRGGPARGKVQRLNGAKVRYSPPTMPWEQYGTSGLHRLRLGALASGLTITQYQAPGSRRSSP